MSAAGSPFEMASAGVAGIAPAGTRVASRKEAWWEGVREAIVSQFRDGAGNRTRQNALGVFAIRVASAALLFLSQIVLARWMGAASYGLYVTLWTSVLVLGGLSHLGLNVAMMRLVPQYSANGAFDSLRGLLFGGRLMAVAMGAGVAALGGVVLWLIRDALAPGLVVPVLLALLCLPMYALTDVQDGIGRGQAWTLEGIVPPYIARPLLLLAGVGAAHFADLPSGVTTAMIAAVVATWCAAALQTLLIQRRLAGSVPKGPAKLAFSKWIGISLPLLAVAGSELVLQNADVLLLNFFRASQEVGVYYAAAKTTSLALFVHYAVGTAYAGRIAIAGALGDTDGLRRLVREAVSWTFWPSVAVTAAILAAGLPLLSLFGPGFADAYPLMFILAAGMLARAATGPSEIVLNMLGQQRACALSYSIAALLCITLNVALIPEWGATGASIATASALSTAAFLNWLAARRLLGLDVFVFSGAVRESAIIALAHTHFRTLEAQGPIARPIGSPRPTVARLLEPTIAIDAREASELDFEIVSEAARFEQLEDDWNDLFARATPSANVFQTFAWNMQWVRHFLPKATARGARLAVVTGRSQGKLVLAWPLVVRRIAGMTHLMWMGDPVSQYGDVLVEEGRHAEERIRRSWRFITSEIAPDVASLRKVRGDARVAPLLTETGAIVTRRMVAPYVDLSAAKDFASFEERYPAKARKNRRRLLRRLEEKGCVRFVHLAGGAAAEELALQAIAMKRLWLADRGLVSSALRDERTERFFAAAAKGGDRGSCCRVSALMLDGEPCASLVSVVAGARLAGHVFAYDLKHQKSGAGVLLLEDCIRWAIGNGYQTLDLLAPGDDYKLDWTDDGMAVLDWALPLSLSGEVYARLYLSFVREQIRKTAEFAPPAIRKLVSKAFRSN